MRRVALTLVFAAVACAALAVAVRTTVRAVDGATLRHWLEAGYAALRAAMIVLFSAAVARRAPARRRAREPLALGACAVALASTAILRPPPSGTSTALLVAGEAFALVAAAWTLASVASLGRFFSILPEARGVATGGAYRLVRHPVYLGELGIFAGLTFAAPSALGAAGLVVFCGAQAVRIRLEERELLREFPEYGDYMRRTGRLVPRAARSARAALPAGMALALVLLLAPAAALAAPARPAPVAPANAAQFEAAPAFQWAAARRAANYEFQLAADRGFRSVVDGGGFQTHNRYATVSRALADGTYYWRVRGIDARRRAGPWSAVRSFTKRWTHQPELLGPSADAAFTFPSSPLVLRWQPLAYAEKYVVTIATDPSLAQPVVTQIGSQLQYGSAGQPITTPMPAVALGITLAPGRYYWAVTPQDARGHRGVRSAVHSFAWQWPTATTPVVIDRNPDPRVDDFLFSWNQVPGAARYEVEINPSADFAPGSRVCCTSLTTGTSLAPTDNLPNNRYYWRVRAVDADGHAGQWNAGPAFDKGFDNVAPTIPDMRVRDNAGELAAEPKTRSPIVAWDPVPGAATYEVNVVEDTPSGCNWTQGTFGGDAWLSLTTTAAWTPLGSTPGNVKAVPWSGTVAHDGTHALVDDQGYCVRVRARADSDAQGHAVVSDWTVLGSQGHPAFTYDGSAFPTTCAGPAGLTMGDACYGAPTGGVTNMPLFTWQPSTGAGGYWVVVARDPQFTDIVDEAVTKEPAYAPRLTVSPRSYADETTSYYYAIMPAANASGGGTVTLPQQDAPHSFDKRSNPPQLVGPAQGSDVPTQPTFQWTGADGALHYELQVAADPSFSNLIDDVTTDSTSYTSSSSYPADSALYWRVRATEGTGIGLTWSQTGTFTRRFAAPAIAAPNPSRVEIPPVLAWSSVGGATSYDLHLEQADGTQRDFSGFRSPITSWSQYFGTGTNRVSVRAEFPTSNVLRQTPGPWSAPASFTRVIDAPAAARGTLRKGRALVTWNPSPVARSYRVQLSTNTSFTLPFVNDLTDSTSYAPTLLQPTYLSGSAIYWRVAAVDDGNNTGAWASGTLRSPTGLRVRARGRARRRASSAIHVVVRNTKGKPVVGASVTIVGPGVRTRARSTGRGGNLTLRVRPAGPGKLVITASKSGYDPGQASLRVH